VITLKEALSLDKNQLSQIKEEISKNITDNKSLGAYVEQFTDESLQESIDGIPIAIKANINVKDWEVTSCSNILKNYISPYNARSNKCNTFWI
jgi:aspartyl-tRNA(Asn)/glutamyl-tRNA(Gln) amidotransferase subunit A